jgi:uridine kinase
MPCDHVLRVAIDGPDAAGKTTLADELARCITYRGRPVVRVSVDGFHQPEAVRRQRGPLSPDGYFHDSFDYAALRRLVLDPLGPGGDRRYRNAVFNYRHDVAHEVPARQADRRAVLLLDGVFLLREELRDCWEASIFVHVSPAESLRRALQRDIELFGTQEAVRERYERRYLPGQELYRTTARPHDAADVVMDNEVPTCFTGLGPRTYSTGSSTSARSPRRHCASAFTSGRPLPAGWSRSCAATPMPGSKAPWGSRMASRRKPMINGITVIPCRLHSTSKRRAVVAYEGSGELLARPAGFD